MKAEDLRPEGAGGPIQLHEKGRKKHPIPCHHPVAGVLRAYIDAAGIAEDARAGCFAPARDTAKVLTETTDGPVTWLTPDA